MTDMDAFDRLVAREVMRATAPPRPVDDAAIFTAITTTRSPKWRFQSMFSATKFVLAGAIVALFGGFLLSGVLTQQPSDDHLPAVGASASATAQAEPTDAATSEPEPTTDGEADDTTALELLPGVDLVTEEVEPDVYRVTSDGVRDLSKEVHDVTVTPEGDVWVELGTSRNYSLVRLGEPGISRKLGRSAPWSLGLTAAGAPVVSAHVTRVLDGAAWATAELTAHDHCVMAAGSAWGDAAVAPDGGCWTTNNIEADGAMLEHLDAAGRRTALTRADLGLAPDQKIVGSPVAGPDGTIWVPARRATERGSVFDGLLSFDGSAWSFVPYDADDAVDGDFHTAVDEDGVVWFSRLTDEAPPVLSWDGESWTPHDVDRSGGAFLLPVRQWPNGTLWFGSDARRDGTEVSLAESAIPWGEAAVPAYAPDGSAWTVIDKQLYVITPEAVAATE